MKGQVLLGGLGCGLGFGGVVGAGVVLVFGSFVVLFGEDCSDGVDDGLVVGGDPHRVCVLVDLSRLRRLLGLLDLIWVQTPLGGSGGEGVCSSLVEVFKDGGEFVLDVVQEPVVLAVDRGWRRAGRTPSAASL